MKAISAIYRSVRHHLHDDWAYGNDLDAKPWHYQQQVPKIVNFDPCTLFQELPDYRGYPVRVT